VKQSALDQPLAGTPAALDRRWGPTVALRVGGGVAVVAALGLSAWLLYALLIVNEPVETAEFAFVGDGDTGVLETAAELVRSGRVQRIVIVNDSWHRVVQLHIVPSLEEMARQRFARCDVPPAAVAAIAGSGVTFRENARDIGRFLTAAGCPRAVYVAPEMRSRYVRHVANMMLEPAAAAALRVVAVPHRKVDGRCWWLSAAGWRGMVDSYFRLWFVWCSRRDAEENPRWNPAKFERALPQ